MTAPLDGQSQPLVSIAMATYNCAHVLEEALDSIAQQTYKNWELVVCDDASTDDTATMLETFRAKHPGRVTVLRNESNRKLAYSLNKCLEHVEGEFVARMDGDDKSASERLAVQVRYLQDHPEVDLVGSSMRRFDGQSLKDVVSLPPSPDRWSMRRGVPFAHATIMTRRRVYVELGGYTVSSRTVRGQDWDLWFRFFHRGFNGVNLPDALYYVREDAAAVKRRTLRMRWRTFQTTLFGYRLLGYPKRWYIRPLVGLLKGLVPIWATLLYRRVQGRRSHETELARIPAREAETPRGE